MTLSFRDNELTISLNRKGLDRYTKISFPVTYGVFSEIETDEHICQFNLNGEISRIRSKSSHWPHPSEWLKRTAGNDWVYYSTGGYTGVFEAIGEYYLPNLPYPTNTLFGGNPFGEKAVLETRNGWHDKLCEKIADLSQFPVPVRRFLETVLENSNEKLACKAQQLIDTIGGRVTVLPPDTRHVDYNVIPVRISRGCLYHCSFCRVKTRKGFSLLSESAIKTQIQKLKHLYDKNLVNYNALSLGEHDALNCPADMIAWAAGQAYAGFDFARSYMKGSALFLFGSVDSLLRKNEADFNRLAALPYFVSVNIGLESACQRTLDVLGKPLTTEKIEAAWQKINQVNDRYPNLEITSNFVLDLDTDTLPPTHIPSVLDLVNTNRGKIKNKGLVYFSPLTFNRPSRQALFRFKQLKRQIEKPSFLYIIQRL